MQSILVFRKKNKKKTKKNKKKNTSEGVFPTQLITFKIFSSSQSNIFKTTVQKIKNEFVWNCVGCILY